MSRLVKQFVALSTSVALAGGTVIAVLAATGGTAAAATPGVGSDFSCVGGSVYSLEAIAGAGGIVSVINSLNPANGQTSPVAQFATGTQANGLGITEGGAIAYYVSQNPKGTKIGNVTTYSTTIYRYDAVSQLTTSYLAPAVGANDAYVAGAVDQSTGIYYYADLGNLIPNVATIFAFNTTTNTAIGEVGTAPLATTAGGGTNGDMAFDRLGDLYLVSQSGSAAGGIEIVPGPLPSVAGKVALTGRPLDTLTVTNAFNGIVFDNSGILYLQSITSVGGTSVTSEEQIDPNTGVVETGTSHTEVMAGSGGIGIDLGACTLNPTLELHKYVQSRAAATDEFALSITGGGVTAANTATTTGSATGLQAVFAGPDIGVSGTKYTFTESGAGTTNLANYTTSASCIDQANNNAPVATQPTASPDSFTLIVPPAGLGKTGPNIDCTFTNSAQPTLAVSKALIGNRWGVGDQFGVQIHTGSATGPVVSNTANETTAGTGSTVTAGTGVTGAFLATAGTTYYLTETAVSGSLTNYAATITCSDANGLQTGLPTGQEFSGSLPITPVAGALISCVLTNEAILLPNLITSKSVSPASTTVVTEGQTVTYTLTFDNSTGKAPATVNETDWLTDVLDDATITTPKLATGSGLTPSTINPNTNSFTTTGTVPAGATATITYTATVKTPDTGNHDLINYQTPDTTPPPTTCQPTDPNCTTNPIPDLVVTKTVSPSSTTPVAEGQTVTYTLTFDNSTGKAPATVNETDWLTDVLDDATITTPKLATGTGLTLSAIDPTTNSFTVTGTVAAGATATITYTATVKTPDTGNHELVNYQTPDTTPPPTTCQPTDPNCTTNPIPDLVVTKTVSPSSTTAVHQGQVLTYTLNFDNSMGKAAVTVNETDQLVDVLDDATVTMKPTMKTGSGLTISTIDTASGTFTISGIIAAGTAASLTYQVTVKTPDISNHILNNYVVGTGTNPPTGCTADDRSCTTNPVDPLTSPVTMPPTPTVPTVPLALPPTLPLTGAPDLAYLAPASGVSVLLGCLFLFVAYRRRRV